MKNSALGSGDDKGGVGKSSVGYSLLHILIVAIISLIIGALVKQ
jgi:MinD superfamily P-loop ATPase